MLIRDVPSGRWTYVRRVSLDKIPLTSNWEEHLFHCHGHVPRLNGILRKKESLTLVPLILPLFPQSYLNGDPEFLYDGTSTPLAPPPPLKFTIMVSDPGLRSPSNRGVSFFGRGQFIIDTAHNHSKLSRVPTQHNVGEHTRNL